MKLKYLFGLLFCVLGFCLYLFQIIYTEAREKAISELNSRQLIHAKQAQVEIEFFFSNIVKYLTKMSESDHIIDLDDQGRNEMDFAFTINPVAVKAITRVDSYGKISYTTPLNKSVIGRDISDQKHVQKIIKTHIPVVSGVFPAVQGYRAIALHIPVFKGDDFRGTLAVLIDFLSISKRFLQEIQLGETGYAWMMSRERIELYCPIAGHTGKSVFENHKGFPDTPSMANKIAKGGHGITSYIFNQIKDQPSENIKKHAVYLPIKVVDNFWTIIVESSEDEVLATLVSFKNKLIIVVGLLLVCIGIFSYYAMKTWAIIKEAIERKKVEAELRKSEERYRELSNSLPQTVFETNEMGELSFVNDIAFELFGYGRKDLDKGLNAIDMIAQTDRDRALENMLDIMSGKILGPVEYTALKKNGSTFPVMIHSTPIISEERPVGLRGIMIDLSKQKNLEKQLYQAQKMESIGNLAGGIAHDFNNILSSIIGFTELSLDGVEKGTPLEDNLQEVYTAGKRARDLVKHILAFARQSDEEQKPIRVDTIAKEVLKLIRSTIPTTIEIKEEIESQSLIMGSPSQIHQLLMNLCTNAAQAMEDAGDILKVGLIDVENSNNASLPLSELKSGNYMRLTVSDTGPGISPDIIDSIFEPYFTTKGVGEGTGMGLALVHGIVESYGGKITVNSELGKGTVFSIYLPIRKKKRENYRPYEKEKLPSGAERILFVDDELPIANMGSQILERLGYQVTVRTSSGEALELFRSKPNDFDLVISDMTMPNMTGDELAMELIAIRSDIPVILCTGYSKKISEETVFEIGIKSFAYKPLVKSDLAKTVRKVLDEAKGVMSD